MEQNQARNRLELGLEQNIEAQSHPYTALSESILPLGVIAFGCVANREIPEEQLLQ